MKHAIAKFLLWIAFTVLSTPLMAKELITWRVIDWPPFYILSGKNKGLGIYDQLIAKMSKALPQYQHKTLVMNTKRVLTELNKGAHVCHPSALGNTPGHLSKINSFLLPHRLIFDEQSHPQLKNYHEVSLQELLASHQYKVGVANQRYPEQINRLLAQHKEQNDLTNQNNYNSLIRMFFAKRVDVLIEYPPVITYSKAMLNVTMKNSSVAIKELTNTKYLPVYFACPKSPWGEKIIKEINQVLIQESQRDDYLGFRLQWYDDKSKQLLKSYYQSDYLADKKRG